MRYALLSVFALLALFSMAYCNSLLVTVAFETASEEMSIKHVEIIAGEAPSNMGAGALELAYEVGKSHATQARFDLPIIASSPDGMGVLDYAEQTLVIPYEGNAGMLSVYGPGGEKLASLDISGISSVGDTIGNPSANSLAGKSGKKSVAQALDDEVGKSGDGGMPTLFCCPLMIAMLACLTFFIVAKSR